MRAYLRAICVASIAIGGAGVALAQSSSPFSGLFGGSSRSDGPVSLRFDIDGDDGAIERQIRNGSLLTSALDEDRTSGQDILAAARGDYARILGSLYDHGYYSVDVSILLDGVEAASVAPLDAPEQISDVVVVVDTGPQFRFSRADIAPVAPETELPSGYAVAEPASTGTIRSAATAGVEGWRNYGHAKADVAGQQITADHRANSVDSRVALNPGPAVTFGKLHISGYERMSLRRLEKIAGFPEGQRFDPEKVEQVRRRLRRSGVFSAITLEESETLHPGNVMDVNLAVVEQKPRRIGAGFEISTTDGAMLSAYWMHRNLLGGGERLRIDGKVSDIGADNSGRDEEITLRIDRPATITPDTTAYTLLEAIREREEDYDSDTLGLSLGFNHIFVEDELTADIAIQYRVSRVTDANGRTDFKVLALPMNVTWDKRDDQNNAKRGFYLLGDVTPFKGFDETGSGARVLGEGRAYYSLGEDDRFTLAGRAQFGTVLGSGIEETPRDYLFYSGGGGTVRGQPYQSLGSYAISGPDGTGIKTGGMSIATLSAEFRAQVRGNIGLVLFADYGELWDDGSWSGGSNSHAGAGVGIRYDTPIGPLRFDVAGPVSGDTGEGVQLYLGLGQAF